MAGRKTISRAVRVVFASLGFLGIVALTAGCGYAPRSGVIAAGSTSVQPFAEVLAEDYMRIHPRVNIDVQGGGSAAGIMAASSGTAQIGMSSRDLTGDELKLWHVEIARDGLALIVNPKNSISKLSVIQVRAIYAGNVTNWKDVGGVNRKIHVVTREDGSGTRSAFESMVMGKIRIATKSIVQDSNGAVRQVIADDRDAIGFVSLGLVNQSVKSVELDGVFATRENVINGTYRLSRPFLFVSKSEPEGQVKQFIDFVLSDDGRKILDAEGLVTGQGSPAQ